VTGGVAFTYTLGALPPSTSLYGFQWDVSRDGGTTWASSSGPNNYDGSTAATTSPAFATAYPSDCNPATSTCTFRLRTVINQYATGTPYAGWTSAWSTTTTGIAPKVPQVSAVNYVTGGVAFTYTLGALPPSTSLYGFQWDVSRDGGATWASSSGYYSYYGTSTSTTSPAFATAYPSDCNPATTTCTFRLRTVINQYATGTPYAGWTSAWSTTTTGTAIGAPTLSSAALIGGGVSVQLAFTAPAQTGGGTITGYQYQMSSDGGTTWSTANSLGASPAIVNACVAPTCAYEVRAVIGNVWMSAWSGAKTVTPLLVTVNPTDRTVALGQPFSFSAAASSADGTPATVQWQSSPDGKAWVNVPGATDLTYTATAGASDDGTKFRAVFTNVNGVATSSTATLHALAVDHLVVAPATATVPVGTSQTYTAEGFAADNTDLGDLTSSATFAIAPDGTCTGTACTASVAGDHTVTATSMGATGTATLSLTAVVPDAPTNVTAQAGDGSVLVSFDAPAYDGGTWITGYAVTCTSASSAVATASGTTSPILVNGLAIGDPTTCSVVATNAVGSSAPSATVTATPATTPAAPTGLVALGANQKVFLAWTDGDNGGLPIIDHQVCRTDASGTACALTGFAATGFTATGLTNGVASTFTVAAVNAVGSGAASTPATAAPKAVPDPPTLVSVTPGNGTLVVRWTPPTDTGGSAISRYTVTCSSPTALTKKMNTPGTAIAGSADLTVTITSVVKGTAYTCTVLAHNATGDGPTSAPSTPVTGAKLPSVPTAVKAIGAAGRVDLTWAPPTSDGGTAITAYTFACSQAGRPTVTGTPTDGSARAGSVTGLTDGVAATCSIAATNAIGTGPAASHTTTPVSPPGAPTSVTAVAGNKVINLTWSAPLDTGGAAVTKYTVTCTSATQPTKTMNITGTAALASPVVAKITGVVVGATYSCTVTAHTLAGDGTASTPVVVVGDALPGTPGLKLTAYSGAITATITPSYVTGPSPTISYTLTCGDTTITVAAADLATIPIVNLPPGIAVTCTAVATNAVGTSAATTRTTTPHA
jgi:hypothetical protein